MTTKQQVLSIITENDIYNPEFEILLEKYLEEYSDDYDKFSILVNYYVLKNDLQEALKHALDAVKYNHYCIESNYNLAEVYFLMGDFKKALKYYLRAKVIIEKRELNTIGKDILSSVIAQCKTNVSEKDVFIIEKQIEYAADDPFRKITSNAGELFVDETGDMSYIGLYNNWSREYCGGIEYPDNYEYELYHVENSSTSKSIDIKGDYILPIVGRNSLEDNNNWICVKKKNNKNSYTFPILNQKSYSYLRLNGKVDIASEDPVVYGKPIKLEHSNKKKLVINLFVDSFNYRIFNLVGRNDDLSGFKELMPKTYSFFSRGVICTNAYSDSEWTTPSLSSYWTGLYSHEHMNVDENIWWPFSDNVKLYPEYFKDAGYMTCRLGENQESANPSQGYMRGIDRFVSVQGHNDAGRIISDVIEQIEAFKDTDQFIWASFEDLHKIAGSFSSGIAIQTNTPVGARAIDNEGTTTVKQGRSINKQLYFEEELKRLDRYFGILFDYLMENYKDDEYVVSLFSDHGTAFLVENDEPMICEHRTHIPMMFYSFDKNGICEDFVQNVDYAGIMCRLCDIDYDYDNTSSVLPKFFGGNNSREYALSQTIYIGDPYQAFIKDKDGSYFLKMEGKVSKECMIESDHDIEWYVDNNGNEAKSLKIEKYRSIIKKNISYLMIENTILHK